MKLTTEGTENTEIKKLIFVPFRGSNRTALAD